MHRQIHSVGGGYPDFRQIFKTIINPKIIPKPTPYRSSANGMIERIHHRTIFSHDT